MAPYHSPSIRIVFYWVTSVQDPVFALNKRTTHTRIGKNQVLLWRYSVTDYSMEGLCPLPKLGFGRRLAWISINVNNGINHSTKGTIYTDAFIQWRHENLQKYRNRFDLKHLLQFKNSDRRNQMTLKFFLIFEKILLPSAPLKVS